VSFFDAKPPRLASAAPAGRVISVTLRAPMDTQTIKNEMAALRERFSALRGYL
jgi:hypothetical protein